MASGIGSSLHFHDEYVLQIREIDRRLNHRFTGNILVFESLDASDEKAFGKHTAFSC